MDGEIIWYYISIYENGVEYEGIRSMCHYMDEDGQTMGLYTAYYALTVL